MLLKNITEQNYLFSKFLRPVTIILFFMSLQRGVNEVVSGLNARDPIDFVQHIEIYAMGLRFDLVVLSFILFPLFLLTIFSAGIRTKIYIAKIYLAISWLGISIINLLNLPYFSFEQKHLNKPEWDTFNFIEALTRWLSGDGLFVKITILIFILLNTAIGLIELTQVREAPLWNADSTNLSYKKVKILFQFLFTFIALAFCARGKIGPHHLRREDSFVQQHSGWNELVLNAQWSFNKDDR